MKPPHAPPDLPTVIHQTRGLREHLHANPWRPHVHFTSPEGLFNDPNGLIYHRGRYHMFYLGRTPIPQGEQDGEPFWGEVWDHVSSADLVHWVHHPVALAPAADGSTPRGIWSGDAIEGAPRPTLVYHVPGQGTCVAVSDDPELEVWTPLPENPVIPMKPGGGPQPLFDEGGNEFVVFDPGAWYEDGVYHLLLGNKSHAPGHEGDCTSYFTSTDLVHWEYKGPFYKSRREWTPEGLDCACPDFFPFGDEHMLLMHGHQPVFHVHYYLGKREGDRFLPRMHGQMSGYGGCLAAPETWRDDPGRRVMIGWLREAGTWEDWRTTGWASAMSLPRVLEPDGQGGVRMFPVPELKRLRREELTIAARPLEGEGEWLDLVRGRVLELELELDPGDAERVGIDVLASPGGEERTRLEWVRESGMLQGRYDQSSERNPLSYARLEGNTAHPGRHALPLRLEEGEPLRLRVFVDRSVVEVFANDRQCLVLRVYPARQDSDRIRLFTEGGRSALLRFHAWPLHRANPW